jgi:dTDP-4-dehydrorhamnose 3,5-epimerase-like enzyme
LVYFTGRLHARRAEATERTDSLSMGAPRLLTIPRFSDHRGSLSVIDWPECLPFVPRRFYYLYDLVDGARRAGHAHLKEEEMMVAVGGSFKVLTDDGQARREYTLDRPDVALYVPALIWHELYGFSGGAVCAVLASERYAREDYCDDYQQFLQVCQVRSR